MPGRWARLLRALAPRRGSTADGNSELVSTLLSDHRFLSNSPVSQLQIPGWWLLLSFGPYTNISNMIVFCGCGRQIMASPVKRGIGPAP